MSLTTAIRELTLWFLSLDLSIDIDNFLTT